MKKEIVKYIGAVLKNIGVFSLGFWKGWSRARKKLKDDNKRVLDMLDD
jgi:hypothetical protein